LGYLPIVGIALGDVDIDGDLDLLISDLMILEHNDPPVRLMFYRNDGTPTEPSWTFDSNDFQNIIRDHRNGAPPVCLSDVDGDGDKDLVLSTDLGLQLFLNPLNATDVDEKGQDALEILPDFISLSCYPNPFNNTARITFSIDDPSDIDLSVYNLLGQRVASVFKGFKPGGVHRFDWEPADLAAGIYFLKLSAGEHNRSVKILYLK
jgi:hypothetical protein